MKATNKHSNDNFLLLFLFVLRARTKDANLLANVIEILYFAQL